MNVGAEPKKVAILGGLILVVGYMFYSNVLSGPSVPAPPATAQTAAPAASAARPSVSPPPVVGGSQPSIRRAGSRGRTSDDWHPSLKRRADDPLDPMQVDPTLRLDLLAKVQGVTLEGGSRNLFQFSTPPPPPAPKGPGPKIASKTPAQLAQESQPKPPGPPVKPPPPPINLKYYGYSTPRSGGQKTAFFLDGDEILVAGEGQVLKRRYKVVRIGVNSVVMEDTESQSQQTLPLAEEAAMG